MTAAPDTPLVLAVRGRRRLRPSGSFLRFVLRRLVALALLLLGITLVAFVLTELVPSNAATTNLGEQAAGDPAAVKAFEQHYGLDKPLPLRYAIYLGHLLHGDLGQSSLTHDAVTHDLGQFIPATAELALYSILFAGIVGITFGVIAALRRNRPDRPRAPGRLACRDLDAGVLDRRSSRSTSASTASAGSPAASASSPARTRRRA